MSFNIVTVVPEYSANWDRPLRACLILRRKRLSLTTS